MVVGREDYVNAYFGVGHLRRGLIDLMVEENAVAPWDRGGALHLNRLLTPEQYAAVAALPPLQATRASVLEAHRALIALFAPRARRLCAEVGVDWPERLEAAARRRIESLLGVAIRPVT